MNQDANGYLTLTNDEKKALINELESGYKKSRNYYKKMRRRWYKVERYLEGSQPGRNGFDQLSNKDAAVHFSDGSNNVDEEFITDNMMLRIYLLSVARLTKYQANIDLTPNSDSLDSKQACRKGRVALYDLLEKNNFILLKQKFARSMLTMGKPIMKVTFDPTKGREMAEPIMDAFGNIKFREGFEGEVRIDSISPRNIQIPAWATEWETMDWLQETNVRTTDYVARKYNVNVNAEAISMDDEIWNYGMDAPGIDNKENVLSADAKVTLVKERYYRPSKKYPRGAIFTWASGELIRSSTLLEFYPDIPYFDATQIYIEGTPWSDTVMYHMIDHQDELNRLESDVMRHTKLMSKPKVLKHDGTTVSDEAFTNETAEFIDWGGTIPPSYLEPPSLPQDVYLGIERALSRMMVLSAAQDVQRPSHGRSGNAIAYEQEMDETTLTPWLESMEQMWCRGLQFALKLMAEYYSTPRLAKMTNSNKTTIEEDFKGEDLQGNFDVQISLMNGFPANKLAKQQFIFQAVDKMIIPPEDAAKYLEFGEADEVLREATAEIEIAQKGIKIMKAGTMVKVHDWDNHEVWAAQMMRVMREEFDDWDPAIQQIFTEVLDLHRQALALAENPANQVTGRPASVIDPTKRGFSPIQGAIVNGAKMPGTASGQQAPPPRGGAPSAAQAGQEGAKATETRPSAGQPQNV